jgi:hypothetical protein
VGALLGGVSRICTHRFVVAFALAGLMSSGQALAQGVAVSPDALQSLRGELDQLRADQMRRQEQIDAIQRRLDALLTGVGNAPTVDPAVQAQLHGRGVTAPPPAPAPVIVLQVGSFRTEDEAKSALARFKQAQAQPLQDAATGIQRADLGAMGVWYRAYVGPCADRSSAAALCDKLKAGGAGCILATMPIEPDPVANATVLAQAEPARDPNFDIPGYPLTAAQQADIRGRGVAPPTQTAAAAPAGAPAAGAQNAQAGQGMPAGGENDEMVVREAGPSAAAEAVTQQQQGIFGDRISFEAGFTYSHFDQARINLSGFLALDAIFLGRISIDDTEGDVTTLDFVARYRPTPRLQFDVGVPIMARSSTYRSGGAGSSASGLIEATRRTIGLADMSVGMSYRAFTETVNRPDIVLNARVKAPTGGNPYGVALVEIPGSGGNLNIPETISRGSGTWGASIGFSALKTVDPVIMFGSFSYFRNFEQGFQDISEGPGSQPGTVKPGDAFQYGAGVAFAVNERASLSFSFSQRFVESTSLKFQGGDYASIVGSHANVASLNIGSTFAFSQRASVIVNVGAGLTRDTPDFSLATRVPFSF